jgi:hypothetical protein
MTNLEKFKYGQFSLAPEEKEKAEKEGRLGELEEKMKKATGRLREKQAEKAVESLEEELKKTLEEKFKEKR